MSPRPSSGRETGAASGLFVVATALASAQFSRGIFIIYMLDQGLSLVQVGIVESCFQLARMATEVPFGALADRWRQRAVIQIGLGLHLVAVVCFIAGDSFWWFAAALALLGARVSAQSGADSAMLYEHLVRLGKEQTYAKAQGWANAAGLTMSAAAIAVGGFLLAQQQWLPFVLEGVFIACGLVLFGRFPEVPVGRTTTPDTARIGYFDTLRSALVLIGARRMLLVLLLSGALLESGTTILSILSQTLLVDKGLSVELTTVALGSAMLLSAFVSLFSHRLVHWGPGRTLTVCTGMYLAGIALLLLPTPVTAVLGLYLVYFNLDLLGPALRQFSNRLSETSVRSTVLSLQSFTVGAIAFVGFPIATAVVERAGYNALTLFVLACSLPMLVLVATMFRRVSRRAAVGGES